MEKLKNIKISTSDEELGLHGNRRPETSKESRIHIAENFLILLYYSHNKNKF